MFEPLKSVGVTCLRLHTAKGANITDAKLEAAMLCAKHSIPVEIVFNSLIYRFSPEIIISGCETRKETANG